MEKAPKEEDKKAEEVKKQETADAQKA